MWLLVAAGVEGCGGGQAPGTVRGPCYSNGTCNAGLACLSMVCVSPGTGGTGGSAGSTGGLGGRGAGGGAAGASGTGGSGGHDAGGAGGAAGAAAGASGTGGAAGATGNGGTGLGCVGSVSSPVTFGDIGQGDTNASFQSGVGALGTNVMYVFSGATSSTGSQEIYLQAFDPKSGASKGAAQPLFAPPTLGFESGSYVGGSVTLFSSAVAGMGNIALAYQLINKTTSDAALYVAFLGSSAAGDGGVEGLQLIDVELVSTSFTAGASGDQNDPKIFWSNASQTFVLNYATPSPALTTLTNPLQMSINKYTGTGQSAGGIAVVPLLPDQTSVTHRDLSSNGSVGEAGSLLGVFYQGGLDNPNAVNLTTLDESEDLVGAPEVIGGNGRGGWAAIAGMAKGFVCAYFGVQYVNVDFVPVSGGTVADGGISGFSLTSLPRVLHSPSTREQSPTTSEQAEAVESGWRSWPRTGASSLPT